MKTIHKLCAEFKLEVLEITYGTHIKARLRAPDGRSETYVFPRTPSDWRALKNKRADLRRFAQGHSTITPRNSRKADSHEDQ